MNLSGKGLRQVRLTRATLASADLRGADLGRADLSRANLGKADLSGAKGITAEQLEQQVALEHKGSARTSENSVKTKFADLLRVLKKPSS